MFVKIGKFFLPTYGLFIMVGVFVGFIMGIWLVKKNKLSTDAFMICAAYTAVGGFVGAKFLYLWINRQNIQWGQIWRYEYFQQLMSGGFVFYGGLAGGITGLWCAGNIYHISVKEYLSVCIPALPMIHGLGRVGCGLVGCCYGIPYEGIFAIQYQSSAGAPLNTFLFPVQYLEAGINFLIAWILLWKVLRRGKDIRNFFLYMTLYSAARFILEFWRYDIAERGFWLFFSTSQWISVGIFLIFGYLGFKDMKKQHCFRNTEGKGKNND